MKFSSEHENGNWEWGVDQRVRGEEIPPISSISPRLPLYSESELSEFETAICIGWRARSRTSSSCTPSLSLSLSSCLRSEISKGSPRKQQRVLMEDGGLALSKPNTHVVSELRCIYHVISKVTRSSLLWSSRTDFLLNLLWTFSARKRQMK